MRRISLVMSVVVLYLVGCSGKPSTPPASTATTTTATQVQPQMGTVSMGISREPREEQHQVAHEKKKDEAASEQTNTAQTNMSEMSRDVLLQQMMRARTEALQKTQAKKMDAAYQAYRESGLFAEELSKRFSDLDAREKSMMSSVFYDQACGLTMGGENAAAIMALDRAIECGWNDLDQIAIDSDLDSLRQLPEFAVKLQTWEQAISAKSVEEAAAELVAFQSYPFDFSLPDLDANPVKLADHAGKVMIVDIWGTWCQPCRAEIPSFVKLQTKYADQGFQIIGLNYERAETEEEGIKLIRDFKEANKMNYPCLIGDTPTRTQVPGFRGYPTTLFIDRSGKVRMQFVGAHPYSRLESIVVALLAEPAK